MKIKTTLVFLRLYSLALAALLGTGLASAAELATQDAAALRVQVSAWKISGNTLLPTETLLKSMRPWLGKRLSLEELQEPLAQLSALYRAQGFPLVQAVLPEQALDESGAVRVEIIEARWGAVQVHNKSTLSDGLVAMYLSELQPGSAIRGDTLDKAASYLASVPGIQTQASLRPGTLFGTSDLEVVLSPGETSAGSVHTDNQGNAYTGRNRVGWYQQFFNPLARGDTASIGIVTSGPMLANARFSYETPFIQPAVSLGWSVSKFEYQLGDAASSLVAGGSAQQSGVWGQYDVFRSSAASVKVRAQLDSYALRDSIEVSNTNTARRIDAAALEVHTEINQLPAGAARAGLTLGWHAGNMRWVDAQAAVVDSTGAHIAGDYGYISVKMQAEHALGPVGSLSLAWSGQWANTNLDGSQKFALGGPSGVRAYETGVLNGDTGQLLSLQWRYGLPIASDAPSGGLWQSRVFWDYGQAKINQKPWQALDNEFAISGWGLGLDWQHPSGWQASLSMAWASGTVPAPLAYSNATRTSAWLELRRTY